MPEAKSVLPSISLCDVWEFTECLCLQRRADAQQHQQQQQYQHPQHQHQQAAQQAPAMPALAAAKPHMQQVLSLLWSFYCEMPLSARRCHAEWA